MRAAALFVAVVALSPVGCDDAGPQAPSPAASYANADSVPIDQYEFFALIAEARPYAVEVAQELQAENPHLQFLNVQGSDDLSHERWPIFDFEIEATLISPDPQYPPDALQDFGTRVFQIQVEQNPQTGGFVGHYVGHSIPASRFDRWSSASSEGSE